MAAMPESIVISNKRSPPVAKYYVYAKFISCKPVICYLGILVDCHLNWNDHLSMLLLRHLISFAIIYLV